MKFERKNILNILSAHQNNIDKRAINALFSSIRMQSNGTELKISSMDGERFLEHRINTKFEIFDIALPGFAFYELLKKSQAEFFEIIEEEKNYTVKIGHGEFKFAKFSNKSWPEWVDNYQNTVIIDSKTLSNALKLVKWASSTDEARPFLNGVCIDIQDEINICATDGLRLALKKLPNNTEIRNTWIMSKKSINDLIKLLDDAQGDIKLHLGKNAFVELQNPDTNFSWKTLLIAGKFPQYSKIIPTTSIAKFSIDTREFVDIIERMMIITNINQPIITLILGPSCKIFAENALSSGLDELNAQYEGPEMNISFNARLLLEMLNNLSQKLTFEINNPHSPILIKCENTDAIFILAPVRRD